MRKGKKVAGGCAKVAWFLEAACESKSCAICRFGELCECCARVMRFEEVAQVAGGNGVQWLKE